MTKQAKISDLSTAELQSKFKAARSIQRTVLGIFVVIVLAWILLGYWRSNLPVFISTLVVAIGAMVSVSIAPRSLADELRKRQQKSPHQKS